jgi:predicted RNA-binding Zn-ribbon protein involved in translation (DUF1610 family)
MQMLMDKGMNEQEAEQRVISIKSRQGISIFANAATRAGLDSEAPKTAVQIEFEHKQALSEQLYGTTAAQDPNLSFQAHRGRDGAEAEIAALAGIAPAPQQPSGGRELSEDEISLMAGLGIGAPSAAQFQTTPAADQAPIAENDDIAFLRSIESQTGAAPETETKSGAISGGIEIPDSIIHGTQPQPEPASQPAPEPVVEDAIESTQVKAECASCGQTMAFGFPSGVEEVRIDCPSCGVEQRVGR